MECPSYLWKTCSISCSISSFRQTWQQGMECCSHLCTIQYDIKPDVVIGRKQYKVWTVLHTLEEYILVIYAHQVTLVNLRCTHVRNQLPLDIIIGLNILSQTTPSLFQIALVYIALKSKVIHLPQVHITHTRNGSSH